MKHPLFGWDLWSHGLWVRVGKFALTVIDRNAVRAPFSKRGKEVRILKWGISIIS